MKKSALVGIIAGAFVLSLGGASLPDEYRQMIGIRSWPLWFTRPVTTTLLRIMRLSIGPESPIEDAAKARLRRAGVWSGE
jgi:hypothetical protein